MLCAGMVFLTGFLGALLLSVIPAFRVQISVFLAALITGCMYGVNVKIHIYVKLLRILLNFLFFHFIKKINAIAALTGAI